MVVIRPSGSGIVGTEVPLIPAMRPIAGAGIVAIIPFERWIHGIHIKRNRASPLLGLGRRIDRSKAQNSNRQTEKNAGDPIHVTVPFRRPIGFSDTAAATGSSLSDLPAGEVGTVR
jgi:hypothetical protein